MSSTTCVLTVSGVLVRLCDLDLERAGRLLPLGASPMFRGVSLANALAEPRLTWPFPTLSHPP
jgi:hypothetical protein